MQTVVRSRRDTIGRPRLSLHLDGSRRSKGAVWSVRREFQRRGIGGALMTELERIIRAAYELGALGSTDEGLPFYRARGWQPWRGDVGAHDQWRRPHP